MKKNSENVKKLEDLFKEIIQHSEKKRQEEEKYGRLKVMEDGVKSYNKHLIKVFE